jgi:hypothetical protein
MHRVETDGAIREDFRTLHQRPGVDRSHGRAFLFVEADADEPEEQADLVGLLRDTTAGG